jgi:hypothetical protein
MTCNTGCNLCMITMLMNKWMLPFINANATFFTLCLPYTKLSSYSTGHVQISNDVKLSMADGAHKDI